MIVLSRFPFHADIQLPTQAGTEPRRMITKSMRPIITLPEGGENLNRIQTFPFRQQTVLVCVCRLQKALYNTGCV